MSGRYSLTPILRLLGRGFLARTRISTITKPTHTTLLGGDAAKRALENAQKLRRRTRLKPCSPWVIINTGCCVITGSAKTTFGRVSEMLPSSSEVPWALGLVARREGHWDESIAYFEQALALDPRNVELLTVAASTYTMLRQFPAALKLYDRALDITPNDPDVMASKASIYQARVSCKKPLGSYQE